MSNFKQLPLAEKAEVILQHGKLVTSFKLKGITHSLYVLDYEYQYRYAEVIMGKSCHITAISELNAGELEKYLDRVVLTGAI